MISRLAGFWRGDAGEPISAAAVDASFRAVRYSSESSSQIRRSSDMRSETLVLGGGTRALLAATIPSIGADNPPPVQHTKANYELASRWTASKVGKLVFDL